MRERLGHVTHMDKDSVTISTRYGVKVRWPVDKIPAVRLGQVVYLSYDVINRRPVRVSDVPGQETDPPSVAPMPPLPFHPDCEEFVEVEDEDVEKEEAFPEGFLESLFGVSDE